MHAGNHCVTGIALMLKIIAVSEMGIMNDAAFPTRKWVGSYSYPFNSAPAS